jgi:hypothetical protein
MPNWQVTWFFEGNQTVSRGRSPLVEWREVWYEDSSASIEFALTQACRTDRGYLSLRLAFTPGIYRATHVRVSNVDNPRETKTAEVQNGVGQGGLNNIAQVNCAVLVDFVAPAQAAGDILHHRRSTFRGLTSLMIEGNAPRRNSVAWRSFVAFCDWLGNGPAPNNGVIRAEDARRIGGFDNPYRIRAAVRPPSGALITAFNIAGSQREILVTAADIGAVVGGQVQVRGVTFPRGVNKTWTVKAYNAGTGIYTLGRSKIRLAGTWDGNGEIVRNVYAMARANQYTIVGMRNRQTGGPFGSPAGRRSGA